MDRIISTNTDLKALVKGIISVCGLSELKEADKKAVAVLVFESVGRINHL